MACLRRRKVDVLDASAQSFYQLVKPGTQPWPAGQNAAGVPPFRAVVTSNVTQRDDIYADVRNRKRAGFNLLCNNGGAPRTYERMLSSRQRLFRCGQLCMHFGCYMLSSCRVREARCVQAHYVCMVWSHRTLDWMSLFCERAFVRVAQSSDADALRFSNAVWASPRRLALRVGEPLLLTKRFKEAANGSNAVIEGWTGAVRKEVKANFKRELAAQFAGYETRKVAWVPVADDRTVLEHAMSLLDGIFAHPTAHFDADMGPAKSARYGNCHAVPTVGTTVRGTHARTGVEAEATYDAVRMLSSVWVETERTPPAGEAACVVAVHIGFALAPACVRMAKQF